MTFFYWLSLVLGGGLFLLSFAGDLFGTHGAVHVSHGDMSGHTSDGDSDWGHLFTLREFTYFLFAFGAVGVGLSLLWSGSREALVAGAAIGTGIASAMMSAAAFQYLRRSESGQRPTDDALVGRVGEVTLPLLRGGMGKILIDRGAGTQELLAKPMDDREPDAEKWGSVVVVEVRDGIAYVAPYSEKPQSSN